MSVPLVTCIQRASGSNGGAASFLLTVISRYMTLHFRLTSALNSKSATLILGYCFPRGSCHLLDHGARDSHLYHYEGLHCKLGSNKLSELLKLYIYAFGSSTLIV
jgi:hypothetical protein